VRPNSTVSMEQSPSWKANTHTASQEIPHLLWNPKVNYLVHKGPSLVLPLSQAHPAHNFPPYFPKIHSTPKTSKWSLTFSIYNQNIVCISLIFHACYMPRPSNPPWFDQPNNTWRKVEVMRLSIKQSSSDSCHFFPLSSKYPPQHPVLKHPQSMFLP